jgi:hypothetical protein
MATMNRPASNMIAGVARDWQHVQLWPTSTLCMHKYFQTTRRENKHRRKKQKQLHAKGRVKELGLVPQSERRMDVANQGGANNSQRPSLNQKRAFIFECMRRWTVERLRHLHKSNIHR